MEVEIQHAGTIWETSESHLQ